MGKTLGGKPLFYSIRILNLGQGRNMYTRKIYRFPGSIEVEEYHTGKYGAPGQARGKKRKPTPEEIKKRNQTNRENYVRRLMKANFRKNDYWITLTYKKGLRPSVEKMRKDVDKLLRKVRSAYRKKGQELKYILRMGIGKRGGPHLHILVNRIMDTDLIFSDQWEHGGIFFKPAYEEGGFKALADYIVKPLEEWEPETLKRYTRSRNLIIPKPKKEILLGKTWRKEPKKKGYYLEEYWEGINPFTGYLSRRYILTKLEGGKERCRSKLRS